jgi:hypothetical protein
MGKKQKKSRQRQFGKQNQQTGKGVKKEKKHLIEPRHKSTIWTVIIVIVLIIFFIINNTRETPAEGPYPPNYNSEVNENVNNSENNLSPE